MVRIMEGAPNATIFWKRSSRCADGQSCVEVADMGIGVGMRDSKIPPPGPILSFDIETWRTFLAGLRAGEFDQPR